jgi:hypothetical protein
MKINLICNDFGWIYEKFIKMFQKHSEHKIVINECGDINHYLPYYEFKEDKNKKITIWASHQELKDPLKS